MFILFFYKTLDGLLIFFRYDFLAEHTKSSHIGLYFKLTKLDFKARNGTLSLMVNFAINTIYHTHAD